MRIEILDEAHEDLIQGFHFYESQEAGLGSYFLDCLFSDIDSLLLYGGIHQVIYAYHRCLSKRFPFAIHYSTEAEVVRVHGGVGLSQESLMDQDTFEERRLTSPSEPTGQRGQRLSVREARNGFLMCKNCKRYAGPN